MKTEYKRDLKNNYLVIEPETEVDLAEYVVHMTEQNAIHGLLPMQVRRMDGTCYLYYEITSCQPMESLYEKKSFGSQDILHILTEMQDVLESVRKYLLNPQQILFDPGYMYVNAEGTHMIFCYYPVSTNGNSVVTLAEYILKKLNHEDARAVALGYSFYQHATEENFSLSETLHKILEENWKENHHHENREEGTVGFKEENENVSYQSSSYDRYSEYEEMTGKKIDRKTEDFWTGDEVFHKQRKNIGKDGNRKKRLVNRIFRFVHPIILVLVLLIAAGLEAAYYYAWIDLTEAGGILFLTLAAAILSNRFWKSRRDRKEKKNEGRVDNRWIEKSGGPEDWRPPEPGRPEDWRQSEPGRPEDWRQPKSGRPEDWRQPKSERTEDWRPPEPGRPEDWRQPKSGRAEDWRRSESGKPEDWRKLGAGEAEDCQKIKSDREDDRRKAEFDDKYDLEKDRGMYGKDTWPDSGMRDRWAGEKNTLKERSDDVMSERTQYLSDSMTDFAEIRLVSDNPDKYPAISVHNKIMIVGKTKGQADILLHEATVSRIHARLERKDNICYIRDMNSRNGTFVNGVRLKHQEQMQIREGDCIMFANIRYYVEAGREDSDRTQLLTH